MRNPIVYFSYMPEDVMNLLNTFLDADSRANLNPILKPSHRHHMKFPTDFALHHSIITFMPAQVRLCSALTAAIDKLHEFDDEPSWPIRLEKLRRAKDSAIKALKLYAAFIHSAQGTTLIQYRQRSKSAALRDLNHFIGDECILASFMPPKVREQIENMIKDVELTPFIRHVAIPADFRKKNPIYPEKN